MVMNNSSSNNKDLFENMPVSKAMKTMAIPTVISQLIILFYSIADTFFIGRTNNPYMVASASLILPVFNICLPIASIMGVGGGALISGLLGKSREEEAKKVSMFSIVLSLCFGACFSIGVFIFMKPLLMILGAGINTYDYAYSYAMCTIVVGGIPTIMTNVLSNLIRSVGESKKAGFGITLGGIINIILDPIFMFMIVPRGQEILGAGIATCLSNFISCAYFIYAISKLNNSVIAFGKLRMPEMDSIKRIMIVGIPSAIAIFLFDVDYIVIDKLMSGYSDIALASIGIVLKAERLPLNVGIGICQAMVPLVAYNFASKNYKRMKDISDYSLKVGVMFALMSIVIYEIFAPFIMQIFISDIQTINLGTKFLRIRSLATVFMFSSFYHVHLFNGYGRGIEALLLGVIRWLLVNIPMLYILNYLIGMYGIVLSQLVSDIIVVIISVNIHKNYLNKIIKGAY